MYLLVDKHLMGYPEISLDIFLAKKISWDIQRCLFGQKDISGQVELSYRREYPGLSCVYVEISKDMSGGPIPRCRTVTVTQARTLVTN
jgi:hypothetical protein